MCGGRPLPQLWKVSIKVWRIFLKNFLVFWNFHLYLNLTHVARQHDCSSREDFLEFVKKLSPNSDSIAFSHVDKGYSSTVPAKGYTTSLSAYKVDKIKTFNDQETDAVNRVISRKTASAFNRTNNQTRREIECVFGTSYGFFYKSWKKLIVNFLAWDDCNFWYIL